MWALFALCCCHNDRQWGSVSYMIRRQHHLVDTTGKLTHQQLLIKQGHSQDSGTCKQRCLLGSFRSESTSEPQASPSSWLRSDHEAAPNLTWRCLQGRSSCPRCSRNRPPQSIESSTINYPHIPHCYGQHLICGLCLGGGISWIWYIFSSFFFACFLFHCVSPLFVLCTPAMRAGPLAWWDATVQTRCGSLNTSCWFPEGKKIPSLPPVALVCPLKPQWPDHISIEAGNHRTTVGNHTHNTDFICLLFLPPLHNIQ